MLRRARLDLTLERLEMPIVRIMISRGAKSDSVATEKYLVTVEVHSIFGSISVPFSSTGFEMLYTAKTLATFKNRDISARWAPRRMLRTGF